MKKIHNNLNIENLMKTEWGNQFNEYQKGCIIQGLEQGLDVSIYATPKYSWFQMKEIRLGLEANLDVSSYVKSDLPFEKMKQIREKLLEERENK